jgi:hypothetical protein
MRDNLRVPQRALAHGAPLVSSPPWREPLTSYWALALPAYIIAAADIMKAVLVREPIFLSMIVTSSNRNCACASVNPACEQCASQSRFSASFLAAASSRSRLDQPKIPHLFDQRSRYGSATAQSAACMCGNACNPTLAANSVSGSPKWARKKHAANVDRSEIMAGAMGWPKT